MQIDGIGVRQGHSSLVSAVGVVKVQYYMYCTNHDGAANVHAINLNHILSTATMDVFATARHPKIRTFCNSAPGKCLCTSFNVQHVLSSSLEG